MNIPDCVAKLILDEFKHRYVRASMEGKTAENFIDSKEFKLALNYMGVCNRWIEKSYNNAHLNNL